MRPRNRILLSIAAGIVIIAGCAKPQALHRKQTDRTSLSEVYETTAKLRHEFAVLHGHFNLQAEARARFIANLRVRYDSTSIGDESKRLDRFKKLIREVNPVMIPWAEFESIAGKPTRIEKVAIPNSDNERTVSHYEFSVGGVVNRWTFYRKRSAIEYHAIGGQMNSPEPIEQASTEADLQTEDRTSTGQVWQAYVEADSDSEFTLARIALRDLLKHQYPNIQGMGKDGFYRGENEEKVWLENWKNAAGLFSECNFIGWPKKDVKYLFGEPREEAADRLVFSFMAGTDDFSIFFEFSNGIVVLATD